MTLTAEQQTLIRHFPLGMVASVRADGGPAVSPKGTFVVLDTGRLAYGDIRSPGTRTNLRRDPRVEVSFLDPFARKSVRVSGLATILEADSPEFPTLIDHWQTAWPDLVPRILALTVISVEKAATILTPPYDDGATKAQMIATYKAKYAEIYP